MSLLLHSLTLRRLLVLSHIDCRGDGQLFKWNVKHTSTVYMLQVYELLYKFKVVIKVTSYKKVIFSKIKNSGQSECDMNYLGCDWVIKWSF